MRNYDIKFNSIDKETKMHLYNVYNDNGDLLLENLTLLEAAEIMDNSEIISLEDGVMICQECLGYQLVKYNPYNNIENKV